jgi:hypothetical protein
VRDVVRGAPGAQLGRAPYGPSLIVDRRSA